jgi:uncharacterized membrane protein YeiH
MLNEDSPRYRPALLFIALFAAILTFYWLPFINRLRSPVQLFDAAGLALFAVSGSQKAWPTISMRLWPHCWAC